MPFPVTTHLFPRFPCNSFELKNLTLVPGTALIPKDQGGGVETISCLFIPSNIARCEHIKTNGTQCGSPALRGKHFCYFHKRWATLASSSTQPRRRSRAVIDMPCSRTPSLSRSRSCRSCASSQRTSRTENRRPAALRLQTASSNLSDPFRTLSTSCRHRPQHREPNGVRRERLRREDFVEIFGPKRPSNSRPATKT